MPAIDHLLVALGLKRPTDPARAAEARAIAELRAYSDRDLAELGIARADIPAAVRHGRPGLDDRMTAANDATSRRRAA